MISKTSLIFRDITYTALIIIVLLPSNPIGISNWVKVFIIVVAIVQRVWQHYNYYKATGKIY
jgi:sterol desaturase/sphingolipid hydroxylase (fatty acid hydroxylase superfamily)